MLFFSTPYHKDNIGLGRNIDVLTRSCKPDDWIVQMDGDTLLFGDFYAKFEQIINDNPGYVLIGAKQNRINQKLCRDLVTDYMFNETDLVKHIKCSKLLWQANGTKVTQTANPIPGSFMAFPRWLFDKIQFTENKAQSIFFDKIFTEQARKFGKVGVAQGFYILHLYRMGKNIQDTSHLTKQQNI